MTEPEVSVSLTFYGQPDACPVCEGKGTVSGHELPWLFAKIALCPKCLGSGRKTSSSAA